MIEQEDLAAQSAIAFEGEHSSADSAAPGMTLIELLTELARRKWLIAKVTGSAMLGGVILGFVLPVKYTALTELMPPQQSPSTASMMMSQLMGTGTGSLAAMAGDGLSLKNPNDIYVGLLKSRPVADEIIRKFGLMKIYGAGDMTAAREKLADNTEVVSGKEGFISVSVTDRDKTRAAEIANDYTGRLRDLTDRLAISEASQRRLFYENQLKLAKESLVQAELVFEQVQQKNGVVELDAQATAIIETLAMARSQVAAKEVEVQALRSYSTEKNPDVQLAEQQLLSLQGQATRLEQHSQSSGSDDVGLKDVPGVGLEYLRAQREVIYQQTLLDLLMKQYDAARLDEAKEGAVIQVVEQAIPPDRRSAPLRVVILVVAALMGLFSSYILVRLQHWLQAEQSDRARGAALRNLKNALIRDQFKKAR